MLAEDTGGVTPAYREPDIPSLRPSGFALERPLRAPVSRGGRFLDNFAASLQDMPAPQLRRGASQGEQFLAGLLGGTAQGFSRARLTDAAARDLFDRSQAEQTRARVAERDASFKDARTRAAAVKADRIAQMRRAIERHTQTADAADNAARNALDEGSRASFVAKRDAALSEVARIEPDLARLEGRTAAAASAPAAITPKVKPAGSGGAFGQPGVDAIATQIADAIIKGDQPADMKGLYRYGGPVRAALAQRGYDFATANADWLATQRWISTANGPQQTRMRQAATTAYESLDVIDQLSAKLSSQVPRTAVKVLNRAALATARNGAFGPDAQATATLLAAQITDVTSELGNVYMGGNSPTDHALQLAAKNLSADWTEQQLRAATDLARTNLKIRLNSMRTARPTSPGRLPGTVERDTRPPLDSFKRP